MESVAVIGPHHTEYGTKSNRTRYAVLPTIPDMGAKTAREALRDNVKLLMRRHFGEKRVTIGTLRAETGIGSSGASAIFHGKGGTRLETLEKVARRFKVQAWQLILPDLNVDTAALSDSERARVVKAQEDLAAFSPAQRDLFLQGNIVQEILQRQPYPVEKMSGEWDASVKRKR